jgi:hypothetical protein
MGTMNADSLLGFGKVADISASAGKAVFPESLDLGVRYADKKAPATSVARLEAVIHAGACSGVEKAVLTVEGTDADPSAPGAAPAWAVIGAGTFTGDELRAAPCGAAVSRSSFRYIRLRADFTAAQGASLSGSAEAYLSSYFGKGA